MRRLIAAPLLAATLALTACGGGEESEATTPAEKKDYVASVKQVTVALQNAFNSVSSGLSSPDPKQVGEALGEGAEALDRTASDLEKIEVPGEISDAHDKLVEGVKDFAEAFGDAAEKAGNATAQQLGEQLGEISRSDGASKVQAALSELKAKGYDIQGAPADAETRTQP